MDPRTQTETCIDLTLCSSSVTLDFNWRLDNYLHGSDHYPILVDFNTNIPVEKPKKWHFEKADWQQYANKIVPA